MEKIESYKNNLPHFQQPGQAYFVTWILKEAVPPKALLSYAEKLKKLKVQIERCKQNKSAYNLIEELRIQYHITRNKYLKAYDDLLALNKNSVVDLSKFNNTKIIKEAIHFWEKKKLKIMLIQ